MQRVLFSIMNPVRFRHLTQFYVRLKSHIIEQGIDNYAFVGRPFAQLPHPVHAMRTGRTPEQLLLSYWDELNRFMADVVQPKLDEGKNIVLDGFGLDAFITAAAMASDEQYDLLTVTHHQLVQENLKSRGIALPTYLLLSMEEEYEIALLVTNFGFDPHRSDEYSRFIARRAKIIKHYFSDQYGQLTPFRLTFSDPDAELCRWAQHILSGGPVPEPLAA